MRIQIQVHFCLFNKSNPIKLSSVSQWPIQYYTSQHLDITENYLLENHLQTAFVVTTSLNKTPLILDPFEMQLIKRHAN